MAKITFVDSDPTKIRAVDLRSGQIGKIVETACDGYKGQWVMGLGPSCKARFVSLNTGYTWAECSNTIMVEPLPAGASIILTND